LLAIPPQRINKTHDTPLLGLAPGRPGSSTPNASRPDDPSHPADFFVCWPEAMNR
jgi:hypothetical protein